MAPTAARRAVILGDRPSGHDPTGQGSRDTDFIRFLVDDGWLVSFVSATPLHDPDEARELRQAGVAVYDGTTAALETRLAEDDYQVAICLSWQIAELYLAAIRRLSPGTTVLVDAPSLEVVHSAQRVFQRPQAAGSGQWLGAEFGSEATGEINAYATADGVLAASAVEADFINTLLGEPGLAAWVPDTLRVAPDSQTPFAGRRGILLPGVSADPGYLDAVEHLRGAILPLLDTSFLERHPVSIVADGDLRQRNRQEARLLRLGGVTSLERFLRQARVVAVPLRHGAGSRRALVQSLLAGTPVVATSAAIQELPVRDGIHLLIADDPSRFAEAVHRVAEDEELWRRLSRAGRSLLRPSHGPDAARSRFLAALSTAQGRAATARQPPAGERARFELRLRRRRNRELLPAIRESVSAAVPSDARILVLSEGADELLRLGVGEAVHFPRGATDAELGGRPATSDELISLLQDEIRAGADFLVVPDTASGWLGSYPGFTDYLREHFSVGEAEACSLVQLRGRESGSLAAKVIAFYLPQFHPIPENDEWWGTGFTEWSNVAQARPLFADHDQPHVPADLGFYDLRLAATRDAQAELAAEAGIHAFCWYHYWFHGERLLERPFDEVLATGRPDFPFCLCWANEPWSRRWDGREEDVLQHQRYSAEDDLAHITWLLPALADRRAVTVDGKPVFLVYHAKDLPHPARTSELWREEVQKAGLPGLYLLAVETDRDLGWDATRAGFDAKLLFQPQFSTLRTIPQLPVEAARGLRVWDYEQATNELSKLGSVGYRRYETVCARWDNSPRRKELGWVLHNSTPERYGRWLTDALARSQAHPPEQRLVFVNAWNEWAEGAHLEPDRRHGHAYLRATRAAIRGRVRSEPEPAPAAEEDPVRIEIFGENPRDPEPAIVPAEPRARAIAFYLPQFHPIPENDEWWGPGFTEWTNVVQARPLFDDHYQPHVPSHLGYYDLRVPEVREAQAELARAHGIESFCYWHYWFSGRRLLEQPFEETLSSGRPDFPFCLAWANESWSRRWLGESKDVLIAQEYSPQDDREHARWLTEAFADSRYLRVDGRPLFLVYRPRDLPDPQRFTDLLRSESKAAGLPEPFLLGINAWLDNDYRGMGFDGTLDFEPRLSALGDPGGDSLKIHDYADARARMRTVRSYSDYPCIVVGWDNTARRGTGGTVFTSSTPEAFELGLRELVDAIASDRPHEQRLVFLNAWNEWAEGNHLEPDRKYGLGYLEAVHRVIGGGTRRPAARPADLPRGARSA